ncbi:DUF2635 domain-containing protein [Haemophilus influenzae]|uniref:Mu-like prophage FluMu protein gp38 n=1 Tax=Haemophilus influenzae (strain ATCC 51907 / DSM 11121 / KW20 / Rd) TaxID=71421 RepID=VG38_HAEIN|nr:DUF2635 domain-containing protein [Haemophilus influenzae]P44232.1 RecName: Full=Mu-like prophage FluMu protein gp38 [Haemophilus influenzae Rd KW20]AAC23157.1 conserved hypothetical protein [Haemophilus influenzae Rd KW20]ARB89457.1 DUF2635 domain-containing protein [Haemophilus influenzae]EEW76904.1 Mu-like prophage FluMu protein gp38 [Haemophilus influenzae RdAW]MCK9046590.1 DUF2635 domain-containing protein [Haemophilus influenzae]
MPTFKIKPKTGLLIRDPETFELLSESGEDKPKISYWLNHLKNGDVELVTETTTKAKNSNKEQA